MKFKLISFLVLIALDSCSQPSEIAVLQAVNLPFPTSFLASGIHPDGYFSTMSGAEGADSSNHQISVECFMNSVMNDWWAHASIEVDVV